MSETNGITLSFYFKNTKEKGYNTGKDWNETSVIRNESEK